MGYLLLDSKATIHKSFSLKKDVLEKITLEANGKIKVGGILLQFVDSNGDVKRDGAWAIIPEWFLQELMSE